MTDMRHLLRWLPGAMVLASALLLFLGASSITPPAAGQTVGDAETRAALLGLREEFVETLYEITPEILAKQRKVVEATSLHKTIIMNEVRVRMSSPEEALAAELHYLHELESLKVMEKRVQSKTTSATELLRTRVEVRTELVSLLKRYAEEAKIRLQVGEIRQAQLASAEAKALKAEIALDALKQAAGQ